MPLPSTKPAFMTRCRSSSAAALEGAHTRMRGLATSPGRLRSNADIICAVISCDAGAAALHSCPPIVDLPFEIDL